MGWHKSFDLTIHPLIPIGAVSLFFVGTAYRFLQKKPIWDPLATVADSPLKTLLPTLSDEEKRDLPYPPDLLPGARDVQGPFGSVRVYEWGPETGRKVLLVHGISTPCLSLGLLAHRLADSGCRVMLFDLFGRGYSDDPKDLKHDARLYTSQILIALASSPLPWTGTNGFSIVGYSLGGGITASFTDAFPSLVKSLVLIAPSGLLRISHIAWSSKFLYQTEGILPEPFIHYMVRQRLWGGTVSGTPRSSSKKDATSAVAAETGESQAAGETQISGVAPEALLFPSRPLVTITSAVQFQIMNHRGFIPAFISAIRNAPITEQHAAWKRIGARLDAQKVENASQEAVYNGLSPDKVLVILGKTDPIIIPAEVGVDAATCFGTANTETAIIDGGHDIPTSHSEDVARTILTFWGKDPTSTEM